MKTIASALVKAQKQFEPARKTSKNPHFRSNYAALDVVVDAVLSALNDNGIFLQQKTHECADGVIVETVFLHESGESISNGPLHVPASKQDAQGYGSALTYARRYSLLAACGIAPEDDDGNAAVRPVQAAQQVFSQRYEELANAIADAALEPDLLAVGNDIAQANLKQHETDALRKQFAAQKKAIRAAA